MAYETVDSFDNRYLTEAPMPCALELIKTAAEAMREAEFCLEIIRRECVETIGYSEEINERRKAGKLEGWDDTDFAKIEGEREMASRLMRHLGWELKYFFCNTPIFDAKSAGDEL